jgi:hypothetical protein
MSLRALIVALLVAFAGAETARSDMLVLESNTCEFPVGRRLPDGEISLPPGSRVRVLLSSHETKVFQRANTHKTRSPDQPFGGTRNLQKPN